MLMYYTIYNLFLYIFCPNSEACLIHHHHPMRHKIDISLVCIVHMYVIHFCSSVLYLTFILTCHVYNMKLIFPFLSFRYPSHTYLRFHKPLSSFKKSQFWKCNWCPNCCAPHHLTKRTSDHKFYRSNFFPPSSARLDGDHTLRSCNQKPS